MSYRALNAQAREEIRMTLARGETLLVTIGIPLLLLIFFSEVSILPVLGTSRVEFLTPGIFALAVMSTSMVSLGIATGFERSYGVLHRLGSTPLRRSSIIGAKIISVVVIEIIQAILLVSVAIGLGWRPHANTALAITAVLLGSVAFAGIGLFLAGTLRAEATLALSNGLYIVLLLLGGILFPIGRLGHLAPVARLLPSAALTDILHPVLSTGGLGSAEGWITLAVWAVTMPVLATLTFRFD